MQNILENNNYWTICEIFDAENDEQAVNHPNAFMLSDHISQKTSHDDIAKGSKLFFRFHVYCLF